MGALSGGNGEWPHDGQPDGLSGLPPEWGTIVIPDDASALDAEAEEIRRELRQDSRRRRWRRRFGMATGTDSDEPSIGLPLLIMAIAVIATLTSLFAVAWPRPTHTPVAANPATARSVPDLTLHDAAGAPVALRTSGPAVLLLVDGCACEQFIQDVAAVVRPGTAVLPVGRTAPVITSGPSPTGVRPLGDPDDTLRKALDLGAPGGTAAVALVSRGGTIVRVLSSARTVDEFRTELTTLV